MDDGDTVRSDEDLIRDAAKGDARAYQQLYDRHSGRTLRYLQRCMNGLPEAYDVNQEVWIKVWKRASQFSGDKFIGWLFRIAHNCFQDWLRKKSRDHTEQIDDAMMGRLAQRASLPDKLDELLQEVLFEELNQAIARLPDNERRVVEMRVLLDYSWQKIGEELGVSAPNAKQIFHRAMKKLRGFLK